jgi:hypothetical protein
MAQPPLLRACKVQGCPKNAHNSRGGRRGYCKDHYEHLRETGVLEARKRRQPGDTIRGPKWKGIEFRWDVIAEIDRSTSMSGWRTARTAAASRSTWP